MEEKISEAATYARIDKIRDNDAGADSDISVESIEELDAWFDTTTGNVYILMSLEYHSSVSAIDISWDTIR
jgi:hypothetical protein